MSQNRDLRLDPATGDLVVSKGDLQLVSGGDAVAQGITIRIRFVMGEWYLDETIGVPYYERILIKNPNIAEVSEWFRLAIVDTPDVTGLESLNFISSPNRELTVNYQASTTFGDVSNSVKAGS